MADGFNHQTREMAMARVARRLSPPRLGISCGFSTVLVLLVSSIFPASAAAFRNLTTITFEEAYRPLFGESNLRHSADGRAVSLLLGRNGGSGFVSSEMYSNGFFSASIKLPSGYTAGVVVAFYASNGEVFRGGHDEVDMEFLGDVRAGSWRLQTNVYGNGSTGRGREERYRLPFDPSLRAHRYSILWANHSIVFYVDNTPVREVRRSGAMEGDYPSRPMWVYATIWDASAWATSGGRYGVDYRLAPFASEFSGLVLRGCRFHGAEGRDGCARVEVELAAADYGAVPPERRLAMRGFREKYMTYSFCYDVERYPVAFPECDAAPSEKRRFGDDGHLKGGRRHRHARRQSRVPDDGDDDPEESEAGEC
ncbi:hypothetical protein Taro_030131 [Colocasia esculenta]|uniref:Xyloglucan endotransglucosylase/hydrolase n=1 Tax=Colocasia esculenta TaxID=4460 RepID=A0A843VT92_COLES|nr:hypothetical protein [Colocasia esculenta]